MAVCPTGINCVRNGEQRNWRVKVESCVIISQQWKWTERLRTTRIKRNQITWGTNKRLRKTTNGNSTLPYLKRGK